MSKKFIVGLVLACCMAALSVGLSVSAFAASRNAQVSSPPPAVALYGCVVNSTGQLNWTEHLGTGKGLLNPTCAAFGETKVAVGFSGFSTINSGYQDVAPGVVLAVDCPTGTMAIGGGVELGHLNAQHVFIPASYGAYITSSHPDAVGAVSEWWGSYGGTATTMRVWAECANVAL